MTTAPWSIPMSIAPCSTPSAGMATCWSQTRAAYAALQGAEKALREEKAAVEAARKEADYLGHAHEELSKLDPRAGRGGGAAAQRAAMMQAEKVVGDLRDAQDSVSGDGSPMSTLSAALRRLERRQPQAPAADRTRAQGAGCGAERARSGAAGARSGAARRRIRSARAGAGRGTAVRPARRRAQICRAGRQPRRRWRKNSPPISPRSTPARRGSSRWARRRDAAEAHYRPCAADSDHGAAQGGQGARCRGDRRTCRR